MAQYIAEKSVALNSRLNNESSEDVLRAARRTLDIAAARREKAEQTKGELIRMEAIDALQNEVAEANQLRLTVENDLGKTRTELADMEAQMKTFHTGDGLDAQAQWTLRQIEALRARVVSLETQALAHAKASIDTANVLEARKQHRESVETELRSATAEYEMAKTKLSDAENSATYRGERLEIMDPGIVPQRPSFPNTPLSVMLAFFISIVASVGYLAIRFGYSRTRRVLDVLEYSTR
jgi:capsule polysaccharide export protein KpsE/RkpR